jgi:hypothetical protein
MKIHRLPSVVFAEARIGRRRLDLNRSTDFPSVVFAEAGIGRRRLDLNRSTDFRLWYSRKRGIGRRRLNLNRSTDFRLWYSRKRGIGRRRLNLNRSTDFRLWYSRRRRKRRRRRLDLNNPPAAEHRLEGFYRPTPISQAKYHEPLKYHHRVAIAVEPVLALDGNSISRQDEFPSPKS